jgi:sugar phosphate isomerase/epimerase
MDLRLSCADYSWPLLDHREVIHLVSSMGVDAIDVGVFRQGTHLAADDVIDRPDFWAGIVRERVGPTGLSIADVFMQLGPGPFQDAPNHPDDSRRAETLSKLAKVVAFAASVGSPGITVLPGVRFDDEATEPAIERAADGLTNWLHIARDSGLALSVEPHVGSCIDTASGTKALLDRVPGLMLTLDPAHFVYQGGSIDDVLSLLRRTRHVQVRAAAPGVMQTRLKDNMIDFRTLLQGLADSDYQGYIATEYVWYEHWGCDRVDNVSETIQLRDLLRDIAGGTDGVEPTCFMSRGAEAS